MKTTKGQWAFLIVSLLVPLLFLMMFVPIWNGTVFSLNSVFARILFGFQCFCLVLAVLRLLFARLRNPERCLTSLVFGFFFVCSLALTCFYGSLFLLELFGIPWFPPQD